MAYTLRVAGLDTRSTFRRRWLMPLAILLVGGSIALWASAREAKRMAAVESRVKAVCESLARGRDLTGTLLPQNPAIEERLIDVLRRTIGGRDDAEHVQVRVIAGDIYSEFTGSSAGAATHTAVLHFDGAEVLALRARVSNSRGDVEILGYVLPPSVAR